MLVVCVGGVSGTLPIARVVLPQDISQSQGMSNRPNTIVDISIRWLYSTLLEKPLANQAMLTLQQVGVTPTATLMICILC